MTPPRDAFQLGPITVRWYGIMIMLGVVLASYFAYRDAKRRGEDPEHVWQMFPWVLVAGIIGARLGWVIADLSYIHNPYDVIAIWTGGLSIQGAVIFGALAVILYCKRSHISFFKWADIIVPGLALAQAVGRWGNYFNQEAFGSKTTLPWGIPISPDRQQQVAGLTPDPTARFHPTFAYEMIWDLINFGILVWLGRQKRFKLLEGDLLWVYLIFYSIGRFVIEAIRIDSATVGDVKTPQLVAVLTVILAWSMLIYRHRPGSTARPADAPVGGGHDRGRAARPMQQARGPQGRVRKIQSFTAQPTADTNQVEAHTQEIGTPEPSQGPAS